MKCYKTKGNILTFVSIRGLLEFSEGRPDVLSMWAQGLLLGYFLPVAESLGTFFTGPPPPTLDPACGTQPFPETDGFYFPSLFQPKSLQSMPKVLPFCLGRVFGKAPSLLLLSAIDSSLLIAVVSFPQVPCSQMCGLITQSSPFQQHCSETRLGKGLLERHWEWLWTYDPNYFWFPARMILSASVLSLSNLWHSKFPHSALK